MLTTRHRTRIGLAALAALTAATLLAAQAADTAPAAKTHPWRVFGTATVDESRPLLGTLWAANRAWVVAPHGTTATLVSARVSAGTLGSFVAVPFPGGDPGYAHFVDDYLAYEKDHQLVMARLLGNGRLGPSKVVADDLLEKSQEADPKLDTVFVEDGVRVGGRIVWALHGSETVGLSSREYFLVCCDGSGAAVDLTRFVDRRVGATFPQLVVDPRGRLWLGWLDRRNSTGAIRGVPRLLELDPSTLAPRTRPIAGPGLLADKVELVCASSCRIVAQSASGDIVSWAPGERGLTLVVRKVVSRVYTFPRELLAAKSEGGRLLVAYRGQTGKNDPEEEIDVVRGDARGARARVIARVATTYSWPEKDPDQPFSNPAADGTFVPGGLLALEHFMEYFGQARVAGSPVVYASLRFRS